jgi:hypothetical protein
MTRGDGTENTEIRNYSVQTCKDIHAIKDGQFFNQLNDYRLVKKDLLCGVSVSWLHLLKVQQFMASK